MVFVTQTECLLSGTDCVFKCNLGLNKNLRSAHTAVFVWISEQTAIISLYSNNWMVFVNRDAVCLLRGTDWVSKCNSGLNKNPRSAHTAVFLCFVQNKQPLFPYKTLTEWFL